MSRLALLVLSLLAACVATGPEVTRAPDGLTPDAGGLQPAGSDLRIDFGRAQQGVIESTSRLLGSAPVEIVVQQECGAGVVTAARWSEGLTLNFLDGDFEGWVLDEPGLVAAGGLEVSMAPPDLAMQVTSLGSEFEQAGIWGLIQDAPEVSLLWSGVTCFFR